MHTARSRMRLAHRVTSTTLMTPVALAASVTPADSPRPGAPATLATSATRAGAPVAPPTAAVVAAVLIAVLLPGCSLFRPHFEAPQLTIVSVELLKSDLWSQHLKVRMRVHNPNERTLPVAGLSYSLEISGQPFADGVSGASFVVPANGEAEFDTTVTTNMAGVIFKILSRESAGDSIQYRISGKVSLSAGLLRSIPFDHHGAFKLQ